MKITRRLFIIVIAILLSVTSTFCWFFYENNEPVYQLYVDLRHDVKVYDGDGLTLSVYKEVSGTYVQAVGTNALTYENMLPGDTLSFQIRISNSSAVSHDVNLTFNEISCTYSGSGTVDANSILNYLYLIVTPGEGYTYESGNVDLIIPENRVIKFSDDTLLSGTDGHYMLKVYDNNNISIPTLTIPVTGKTDSVNLNCRIWLDVEALGCEDIVFNIGQIVISV